jgi:hypothetical protein
MTLAVIRDVPRACFVLLANGKRIGEFETEAAAWEFAEDAFGVAIEGHAHGEGELRT